MRIVTYDVESFIHDWIVVFKDFETGQHTIIHNDPDELRNCIHDEVMYVGFNSKHYDQYIIKAICCGFTPEEIKRLSDYIIFGNQGWEYPALKDQFFKFNNADVRDDMYPGLSLKAIEGHLHMDIEESEISFDLNRQLTKEEVKSVSKYCTHDVDATEAVLKLRWDYFKTKQNLGKRAGISVVKSLSSTNAKLTALMLKAERKEWTDGRDYTYPENIDKTVIPKEVLDFFDTIHDTSKTDEELFSTALDIEIGGMPVRYKWGGVHGSLTAYHEEETETRCIENRDVSSLYPSLIEEYNYLSRNVPDPNLFYAIRRDRIEAKHKGDKQLASDLKLPLNTVSGAQENRYNDLYDPLPTRSLRISGQLFLTMLTVNLLNACKTIKLLNLNTDGVMYSIDRDEVKIADEVSAAWEKETRFELEVDHVKKVWIKDVNNLLMVKTNGEVKTVGGYLNYGISNKGAWKINNNAPVIKKALIEYFANDTPVEETILNDEDIFDFQFIAQAGVKYKEAFHEIDGERIPVQKVNRVYATSDERYGKVYKVKKETGQIAKIENLPEHCLIDNDNHLTIKDVDKTYYIDTAKRRIEDYRGLRRKTMAEKKMDGKTKYADCNVYQKLLIARSLFLDAGAKKSGKHMELQYKYFELDDIVPKATDIFMKIGLIATVSYSEDKATMYVTNTDAPDEYICFDSPMRYPNENRMINPVQSLGSAHTYIRRYLYMMALDICEPDSIEPTTVDEKKASRKKVPSTPEQREEIKEDLTDSDGNATELQIKGLKKVCKKVKDTYPDKEEMIAKISLETKAFTKISKKDCEALIKKLTAMLEDGNEKD